MKSSYYISSLFIALSIFGADVVGNTLSQNSIQDSLILSDVIQKVIASHPSIKEAEEALNVADARISLAKSGYLPDVDVNGNYSHIGPVSSFDMPSFGHIQLYPADNYSASLNYRQTLYDFGKTSNNVKLEKENKNIYSQNIELAKQKLAIAAVNNFYNMVFLQEAIRIKNEELDNLKNHLEFVEKKRTTGSATSYEILSTKVKISNTESQKSDLENMLKVQQAIFNSLTGLPANNVTIVKQSEIPVVAALQEDSLLDYAYTHRIEMALSKEKETMAGLQYKLTKSQNNPVLSAMASAGGKNGYVPELNKVKANYSVGVGLRIPIFDGNRLKNNLVQVQSGINNASFETEIEKRNISNEVIENESNLNNSFKKISLFELQLEQAKEAYKLAQVSYETGAITNLDLLDAETRLSESTLQLLKAKVDYSVALYKLKTAIGDKLYEEVPSTK
ncbi:MAG TPA: TolC family protein [Bacteroidales bacterium]|nr:TolC family protein [Bacteroidales bacterium]